VLRRGLPKPADEEEARVVEKIREHGWYAWHVRDEFHPHHEAWTHPDPAVEAASCHGFSYTVGLWPLRRRPELIVTGNWGAMEKMHDILGAAVERVFDGAEFHAGDEDDQVLERLPVRFGPVARLFRLELLTWSHWAARRRDFEALQLLLPDREARWPGDAGYAGPPQPLLGEEPG
jgi:hypothetical protein